MRFEMRCFLCLLALIATPAFAQRHFFGFDNDLEGWQDLHFPNSSDRIVWEADVGVPPGAMRSTGAIAVSPCLPTPPDGEWHIAATVFANTLGCLIKVEWYDLPDCSDGAVGLSGLYAETRTTNEWVDISFDYPLGRVDPYFTILAHPLSPSLDDYCYIDNVEAIGPLAPPSPVPTLDDTAMLVLAALIAAAGALLVRRTRA